VAAGLVLALAGPAAAKGPVGATITAPDGTTVALGGDENDAMPPATPDLITRMGLWRAFGSDEVGAPAAFTPAPPDGLSAEALGPRFQVDWSMYHGGADIGALVVTQFVYPQAPGGPVVFTPAGQLAEPYIDATVGGWARTTGDVAATLTALGVDLTARGPAAAPEPDPAPAARPTSSPASDPGPAVAPLLAGAGVAAAAAVAGVVLVRRHRRDALAAPG
jgi:hypothetical protein